MCVAGQSNSAYVGGSTCDKWRSGRTELSKPAAEFEQLFALAARLTGGTLASSMVQKFLKFN